MRAEPQLVFADGVSIDPRQLVIERAKLAPDEVLELHAKPVAVEEPTVDCPISTSGTLNHDELYRDPRNRALGYTLPIYFLAQVKLELTPDAEHAGTLRVFMSSMYRDINLWPEAPRTVTFDRFPDGSPVTSRVVVEPDMFRDAGIRVVGAPEDDYCQNARAAALIPAGTYRNRVGALSSTDPSNLAACHTVPIEITFDEPVRWVSLSFIGAVAPYTLKLYSRDGVLLHELVSTPDEYGEPVEIGWETDSKLIGSIRFGSTRALTLVSELRFQRGHDEVRAIARLPHKVSVGLRYLASDNAGTPDSMATWKELPFDSVVHQEFLAIDAVLHLSSLRELDAVYRALSEPPLQCQVVVRFEAELAVRSLNQILIRSALRENASRLGPELEVFELPTAEPELQQLLSTGSQRISMRRTLSRAPHPKVNRIEQLGRLIDVLNANRAQSGTTTQFGWPSMASRFIADSKGRAAFVKQLAQREDALPCCFDPRVFPDIFPDRVPGSGAGLLRYAVTSDQIIFQDALEPSVFHFVPDEFRLSRDDVRSPTFRPSMHVAFFSSTTRDDQDLENDVRIEYSVQFTFRAVPYLAPGREAAALRYIREHELAPHGRPVSLLPLTPEWTLLTLRIPNQAGPGTQTEERPDATVVFDRYVSDSLTLSSNQFAEVFNSMRVGGETFNGAVQYRLPGSSVQRAAEFSGRLDKMVGPVFDLTLPRSEQAADGTFVVRLVNAIESKVTLTLTLARFELLKDPAGDVWIAAHPVNSGGSTQLEPGASVELSVQPETPLGRAFNIRVSTLNVSVELDYEELWRSVLATPGWDDITQPVTVEVDASYFTGSNPLDHVRVLFNAGEVEVRLDESHSSLRVQVIRPFLATLLGDEHADEYFYRVQSWRRPLPDAEPIMVAEGNWTDHKGPSLPITPLLG